MPADWRLQPREFDVADRCGEASALRWDGILRPAGDSDFGGQNHDLRYAGSAEEEQFEDPYDHEVPDRNRGMAR